MDDRHHPDGRFLDQPQRLSGDDPGLREVGQFVLVAVADPGDDDRLADRERRERRRVVFGRRFQGLLRDRIAVGVDPWIAHPLGDALLELLADVVFQHVGLLVDVGPLVIEVLDEERLQQAMVTDDLDCDRLALLGQLHALVLLAVEQTPVFEFLHHTRDRRRGDVEIRRDLGGPHRRPVLALELVDRLQVILHHVAQHSLELDASNP